jgi:hypothetical protein
MKMLILSRYGRLGASSRLRMFQYEPYLRSVNFEPEQRPFFDDTYLMRLYQKRQTRTLTGAAFARRLSQLFRIGPNKLLWIEKEALPWVPWLIERSMLPRSVPLVTDYDDAVFHRYDLHRLPFIRRLLGRKIDQVMAASALVTAGNSYLADRARAAGANWIEIVPTVVDIDNYSLRSDSKVLDTPRIGWIGTPSTWTEFMVPMMPLLETVAGAEDARLTAVGAGKAAASHPLLDILPWSEQTEVTSIQDMDIGIMPLTDTPWARGKCGYKLIQYMACGVPVIASPVGVNAEIVEHGVNGFLASTEAEWHEALVTLLRDPDLRRRMGAAGRKKVEYQYSLQVWGPRVAGMLKDVVEKRRSCST